MKYYGVRSKIIYTPTPTRFFNICCGKIGKKIWRSHRQITPPNPCTPPHPSTVSHWVGCIEAAAKYLLVTVWFSVEVRGVYVSVIRVKRSFCTVLVCHYDTVKSTLQFCWNLCKNSRNSLNINHLHTIYSNPTYQFRNYTTKIYHKIRNNIPKSVNRH